jgi:hypothetical protein
MLILHEESHGPELAEGFEVEVQGRLLASTIVQLYGAAGYAFQGVP